MPPALPFRHPHRPPQPGDAHWGRARTRALIVQALFLGLFAAVVMLLVLRVWAGLRRDGIAFSFSFLAQPADFDIAQGLTLAHGVHGLTLTPFVSSQNNGQALLAGVYNTLVAAFSAIVLSTVLGVLLALARMARNWLASRYAWAIIEFIRNTPLLIQILFWYFGVFLRLPAPLHARHLGGLLVASRRGVHVAWVAHPTALLAWLASAAALALLAAAARRRGGAARWRQLFGAVLLLGMAAVLGWGNPGIDLPRSTRFAVHGGFGMSPEMLSLVVALTVNTAAYVAEIVRGAVGAIDKGQWEAAAALGLSQRQAFWMVVLPQATKMIVPSLGNQYISLAKNTSFGIAIGFPDLFNVYGTVANQTGHPLAGIVIVMVLYLGISLFISAAVNAYNRRIVAREAR